MASKNAKKQVNPLAPTDSNIAPQQSAVSKYMDLQKPAATDITQRVSTYSANLYLLLLQSSSKRKAAEIGIESDDDDDYDIIVTENCDQVRRKLRAFINAREMKLGELHNALGVSGKSFNTFMGQNGPAKGVGTATYLVAFKFFKKREAQGIKVPKKKAKKAEEVKKNDVSGIQLEGEDDVSVPVYDSCDEIRKKVNAYLRGGGVTQAGFLREAAKTYPDGKKMQSKVLGDFLGKKGAKAGNTSAVFYSSYVFFEKMRIRDGKPKTKHRLEMEKQWPGGFDTKNRNDRYFCYADERPYEDQYGKVYFKGRGRR